MDIQDYERELIEREREIEMQVAKENEAFANYMKAQGKAQCSYCDSWENEEDLICGICESCVDDIITRTTVDQVADYASTLYVPSEYKYDNELALYTDYLFTRAEAIGILKDAAKLLQDAPYIKRGIKNYIENDREDYIEYLEKKGAL